MKFTDKSLLSCEWRLIFDLTVVLKFFFLRIHGLLVMQHQCVRQKHQPLLLNQLLCWIQLFAELLHLLVVTETLFVILVKLQTLADVAESEGEQQDKNT